MNPVIPIIVGFEILGTARKEIQFLNEQCDRLKGINFESNIPHVTLWMGFVHENDLLKLKKQHLAVFSSIEMRLTVQRQLIFEGLEGAVLSLEIENERLLSLLQNRIHHFYEPYRIFVDEHNDFITTTVQYINNFGEKSLDFYDPHVTVGFSREVLSSNLRVLDVGFPKIFHVGNHCTALERLL